MVDKCFAEMDQLPKQYFKSENQFDPLADNAGYKRCGECCCHTDSIDGQTVSCQYMSNEFHFNNTQVFKTQSFSHIYFENQRNLKEWKGFYNWNSSPQNSTVELWARHNAFKNIDFQALSNFKNLKMLVLQRNRNAF